MGACTQISALGWDLARARNAAQVSWSVAKYQAGLSASAHARALTKHKPTRAHPKNLLPLLVRQEQIVVFLCLVP